MKLSKALLLSSLSLFMFSQAMANNTDETITPQESAIATDAKKSAPGIDKQIKKQSEQKTQADVFTLDEQADEYFGQPKTDKPTADQNK